MNIFHYDFGTTFYYIFIYIFDLMISCHMFTSMFNCIAFTCLFPIEAALSPCCSVRLSDSSASTFQLCLSQPDWILSVCLWGSLSSRWICLVFGFCILEVWIWSMDSTSSFFTFLCSGHPSLLHYLHFVPADSADLSST